MLQEKYFHVAFEKKYSHGAPCNTNINDIFGLFLNVLRLYDLVIKVHKVVFPQSQYDTFKPVLPVSKTITLKLSYPDADTYVILRTWSH